MIDCSQASADAYNALRKIDQYNYFLGQKDMCILLLNNLYNVPFDCRILALDKTKRKNIIDSIFENFKPQ